MQVAVAPLPPPARRHKAHPSEHKAAYSPLYNGNGSKTCSAALRSDRACGQQRCRTGSENPRGSTHCPRSSQTQTLPAQARLLTKTEATRSTVSHCLLLDVQKVTREIFRKKTGQLTTGAGHLPLPLTLFTQVVGFILNTLI